MTNIFLFQLCPCFSVIGWKSSLGDNVKSLNLFLSMNEGLGAKWPSGSPVTGLELQHCLKAREAVRCGGWKRYFYSNITWFESQSCCLLVVWFRANYLNDIYLSFPIRNIRIIILPTSLGLLWLLDNLIHESGIVILKSGNFRLQRIKDILDKKLGYTKAQWCESTRNVRGKKVLGGLKVTACS